MKNEKYGDDGLEKMSIQKIINEGRCLYLRWQDTIMSIGLLKLYLLLVYTYTLMFYCDTFTDMA